MSNIEAPHLWVPRVKILEPRDPVTMPVGMAGEFRMKVYRPDGRLRHDTGYFKNLITDVGLNTAHGGTTSYQSISVGTSSTTPTTSDTVLGSRVATSPNTPESSAQGGSGTLGEAGAYRYVERTWRFSEGDAAGNLTEVGLTTFTNPWTTYSRALILDGEGSPTTLTVLSDEFLDVTYRVRYYPGDWTSDVETSIDISGNTHDIVLRPSEMDGTNNHWRPGDGSSVSHMVRMGVSNSSAFSGAGGATIYPETYSLGDRFSSPSGASTGSATSDSQTNATYTNDTFFRDFSLVWGLNKNTSTGNIANIVVHSGSGNTGTQAGGSSLMRFQFSLDPYIEKTTSQILTMNFRAAWARST